MGESDNSPAELQLLPEMAEKCRNATDNEWNQRQGLISETCWT